MLVLKDFGKFFLHLPLDWHVRLKTLPPTIPHGPWIIVSLTIWWSWGWVTGSGISAEIKWSMPSSVLSLSLFQAIVICVHEATLSSGTLPHESWLSLSLRSLDLTGQSGVPWVCLKTRETKSGQSDALCPGKRLSCISFHLGLQVMVTNRSGFPLADTMAIASWYSCFMFLWLPE